MIRPMFRRAIAAACVFLLPACDTLGVRVIGEPTPLFRAEDPEYVGRGRDFHVILQDDGATLGGSDALRQAALAGLQDNSRFPTRFTTTPQTHDKDFRVVLIFNPAPDVRGSDLCREPIAAPRFAPSASLHVQGAFCRAGDVLTEAEGYVSGAQKAGDSRFRALMTAFARQLLPSRDLRIGDTPE
jgi:hypothetical protein